MPHNNGTLPYSRFVALITVASYDRSIAPAFSVGTHLERSSPPRPSRATCHLALLPAPKGHARNVASARENPARVGYGCHRNRAGAANGRNGTAAEVVVERAQEEAHGCSRGCNREAGANARSGTAARYRQVLPGAPRAGSARTYPSARATPINPPRPGRCGTCASSRRLPASHPASRSSARRGIPAPGAAS